MLFSFMFYRSSRSHTILGRFEPVKIYLGITAGFLFIFAIEDKNAVFMHLTERRDIFARTKAGRVYKASDSVSGLWSVESESWSRSRGFANFSLH